MKKVTPQSIIGQQGASLVEHIILSMKYIWRPILIFDVGVDGEIEICDPASGEAMNATIRVQIKATTKPFHAETADSFEYYCEQKDLDYWLRGNASMILIVCRPDTNEAYWVSIKDYFSELAVLKSRKIHFNKNRNRFDINCAEQLKELSLPKDSGIYFAPLSKTELLFSNLLQVKSFSPKLYVASTDYRKRGEIWANLNALNIKISSEWILTNKQIISFQNLEQYPYTKICDSGTIETFDTNIWANSLNVDRKREFVQLLNVSLKERAYLLGLKLYLDKNHNHFFFPATKGLRTRKVWYQSLQQRVSREVFKQYQKKKDPSQRAYCRHSAFKGYFLRIGQDWYLEITPTYHFTSDGYDIDPFASDRLKGIKRLDRNPAVLGQLLMWADLLSKPIQSLFSSEYLFLSFGELVRLEINNSIPDDIWYQAEEGEEAESLNIKDNQLGVLGL